MGAHTRALDTALNVAEQYDVQVALHTDGLNECLSVDDTLSVFDGRTIHAFHIEGCGGGHVPNVLKLAGVPNVIGSSTNPTLPFGRDALDEHYEMIFAAHGLNHHSPSDHHLVTDRIRGGTMGAEGVLHDLGVIGITSSDAQGMGRAGETVRRTFQLAAQMKRSRSARRRCGDGQRQRPRASVRRQADDQPGDRPWPQPRDRLARRRQAGRHRALASRSLRGQAAARAEERLPRLRGHRRPERGHRLVANRWCSARSSDRSVPRLPTCRSPSSAGCDRCRRRPHDHPPSTRGGGGHPQHRPGRPRAQQPARPRRRRPDAPAWCRSRARPSTPIPPTRSR